MEVNIIRSSLKVLWIDTSRIWNLDMSVWKKIAKLIVEGKIIVVDTGQFAEMIERYSGSTPLNEKSKTTLEIYRAIVDGYIALDHVTFQSRQNKIAMEAFVKGEDKVEYSFSGLFDDLLQSLAPTFDQLNEQGLSKVGTPRAFKVLSPDIVGDWKTHRQDARIKKQTLRLRQEQEILGMHDALLSTMKGTDAVKKKNLVDHYLRKWKRASGNSDPNQMLEFFKSKYYKSIPYINIYSWIISDLITGEEDPRDSDYFDAIMISMMLPYADFMLIDGSMRNRIVDKLKLVKPKGVYDCKLITLPELGKILDSL